MSRQDPKAPPCPIEGCKNKRASRGKRKDNPDPDQDQFRRFSYCHYHRKHPKGKAARIAFIQAKQEAES